MVFSPKGGLLTDLQVVDNGTWRLFHKRAAFVRSLCVDFRHTRLPYYFGVYGFLNPLESIPRSRAVFPELTSLRITVNRNDAHLLNRFLCGSLRHLHLTLYPPFPGSALMDSILAKIDLIKGLLSIRICFDNPNRPQPSACETRSELRQQMVPGAMQDASWMATLLRRLPSLADVQLEGCWVTPGIQMAVSGLKSLKRAAVCVHPHAPAPNSEDRWPSVAEFLTSVSPAHLQDLTIRNMSASDVLDVEALARFSVLKSIDLRSTGLQSPIHIEALVALTSVESVAIRFPHLDTTLTPTLFRSLVCAWPSLTKLILAVPMTPFLPCFIQRPKPVLQLRDLGILGERCPRLTQLLISVNTKGSHHIPPPHPIKNPMVLDLHDVGLAIEDAPGAQDFIQLLFPNIRWLQSGYPAEAWKGLEEANGSRIIE